LIRLLSGARGVCGGSTIFDPMMEGMTRMRERRWASRQKEQKGENRHKPAERPVPHLQRLPSMLSQAAIA
jgi:hypothetical protein